MTYANLSDNSRPPHVMFLDVAPVFWLERWQLGYKICMAFGAIAIDGFLPLGKNLCQTQCTVHAANIKF
jgi:hypothetical protein